MSLPRAPRIRTLREWPPPAAQPVSPYPGASHRDDRLQSTRGDPQAPTSLHEPISTRSPTDLDEKGRLGRPGAARSEQAGAAPGGVAGAPTSGNRLDWDQADAFMTTYALQPCTTVPDELTQDMFAAPVTPEGCWIDCLPWTERERPSDVEISLKITPDPGAPDGLRASLARMRAVGFRYPGRCDQRPRPAVPAWTTLIRTHLSSSDHEQGLDDWPERLLRPFAPYYAPYGRTVRSKGA